MDFCIFLVEISPNVETFLSFSDSKSFDKVKISQQILMIKMFGLDTMDNLDKFQKLVSTLRTMSISIGLDCRDPQA